MTQRERRMLLVLIPVGGFGLLFAAFLGFQKVMDSLAEKDDAIAAVQSEILRNQEKLVTLVKAQRKWDRWRAISLPPDAATANHRYKAYLHDLSRAHRLEVKPISNSPTTPARGAMMTPMKFVVNAEGTLGQLIAFLKDFYSINLPHQIRDVTFKTTAKGSGADTKLDANIVLEALTLPAIPHRDFITAIPDANHLGVDLLAALSPLPAGVPWGLPMYWRVPAGVGLGLWAVSPAGLFGGEKKLAATVVNGRDYGRLTNKNVFVGLAPPAAAVAAKATSANREILKYVRLTDINSSASRKEAGLYNQRKNESIRLRMEAGRDTFTVRDSNDQVVVVGRVKQINRRDVIFLADEKHFAIHVGENLFQAMQKELNEEEIKALARK